ncbi:hypothetical protein [Caldisericum sp.]|uniref:hypothetical protein n=1 Tax=Caldisericum sp. TaxID=2499687 RepID=UPI003D0D8AEA
MKKITEHLSILNIKTTEKGISGFYKPIGGFFLVERGTQLPEGEYVEIEIVKKIIDKRGKEVPIVRLLPHYHKFENADDRYHECECGYWEKHSFKLISEEEIFKDFIKETYKCEVCGYEKVWFTCPHGTNLNKFPHETYFHPQKKDLRFYYLCYECIDKYLRKSFIPCVICGENINEKGWGGEGKTCKNCTGLEGHCAWLWPRAQVWDDTCPRCRGTFKCFYCGRELPLDKKSRKYGWYCLDCVDE